MKGHIADSVNVVAWALDKVIKDCLGDPSSPRVITQTIEKNVWNSTLKLSAAFNSTPLQVEFDNRARRVLPMALGNLVNGKWKVAGMYSPATKQFEERSEIIQWPKTNKSAPRSWFSCNLGERLIGRAHEVQQCEPCKEGTFSAGGQSTFCAECTPGEGGDLNRRGPRFSPHRGRYDDVASIYAQATSSPIKGSWAASVCCMLCVECCSQVCALHALTGYFQPERAQFGCLSCDSLGDFYQELQGQTSCQFCAHNTQRYIGVLSGADRRACQCKEGAIFCHQSAMACMPSCLRASVSTGPPTAGYHNARLEAGEVCCSRHPSFPCTASDESTTRFRVCRSVRNVRRAQAPVPVASPSAARMLLALCGVGHVFASRSSRRFMSWPVEPSLSGFG